MDAWVSDSGWWLMNEEVIMVEVKSLDSCGSYLTITKKGKRFEENKTSVWSRYAEFMVEY